jgi:hypothetical protein
MFDRKDFVRRVETLSDALQSQKLDRHSYQREFYERSLCALISELPDSWGHNVRIACGGPEMELTEISAALSIDAGSNTYEHESLIPLQVLMRLVFSMRSAGLA